MAAATAKDEENVSDVSTGDQLKSVCMKQKLGGGEDK